MALIAEYTARVAAGGISSDPAQLAALEHLEGLLGRLDGWRPGIKSLLFGRTGPGCRGVYLHGGVGGGKSMLMDLFFEAAQTPRKRRAHFHEFMQDVHAGIADARRAEADDPIAKVAQGVAQRAWLLCFDEMQVNDIGDAMILGRLFEALFGRGVVLVTTSNRPPEDLYKDGINRQLFTPFIDMLRAHTAVVEVQASQDYRLSRLQAAGLWHSPLGSQARAEMDAIWAHLIRGDDEHGDVLTVQGRLLRAPRTGAGAARFSFEALCGQPLGPADYLALTRRFHTLVLDDIPQMGPDKRNEAKRFVTLVDTLYEARTKLVASAAGEPETLYPDGDGSFEFARTASRLREMRSEEYLGAARQSLSQHIL